MTQLFSKTKCFIQHAICEYGQTRHFYSHLCPAMVANDLDGLDILPGADVHLGRCLGLITALGPVGLLCDQHLLVHRVARADKLLVTAEENWISTFCINRLDFRGLIQYLNPQVSSNFKCS